MPPRCHLPDPQHADAWTDILRRLPADLDTLAFRHGALFRKRKFRSAALLLRLLLAYATGLSMPLVTAWAAQRDLVRLTPEALQQRLACARHWLQALVLSLLTGQATVDAPVRRLLLVDGTHAPRPGARSQDWRLHLCLDLQHATLADARVAPQAPGESFAHAALQAGDLVVGDRNYGTRPNLRRQADGPPVAGRVIALRRPADAAARQHRHRRRLAVSRAVHHAAVHRVAGGAGHSAVSVPLADRGRHQTLQIAVRPRGSADAHRCVLPSPLMGQTPLDSVDRAARSRDGAFPPWSRTTPPLPRAGGGSSPTSGSPSCRPSRPPSRGRSWTPRGWSRTSAMPCPPAHAKLTKHNNTPPI